MMVRGTKRLVLASIGILILAGTASFAYFALPRVNEEEGSSTQILQFRESGDQTKPEPVPVGKAVSRGLVAGRYFSNGHDTLTASLRNLSGDSLLLIIDPGLVFESGDTQVVTIRSKSLQLAPSTETRIEVMTVATSARPLGGKQEFGLTGGKVSKLAVLIPYVQKHPEIPQPAIQTAVLALTENLPLSTFAKFSLTSGKSAAVVTDSAFKVETRYIIQALQMLDDTGWPMDRLALTVDPQLMIEAMIDPLAHAAAMKYYGIKPEEEWNFWKSHLVHGDEATRHYALYGIGRYFPDVAVEMLPKWARDERVKESFRVSAIESLALTGKLEAVSILDQLQYELSGDMSLELASYDSALRINQTVFDPHRYHLPIPFRLTMPVVTDMSAF